MLLARPRRASRWTTLGRQVSLPKGLQQGNARRRRSIPAGSSCSPTTSAPTGATHGQMLPANMPKSAYTMRPGKWLPAKTQRKNAARPAIKLERAATLIRPIRSLARPMSGLPMPCDTAISQTRSQREGTGRFRRWWRDLRLNMAAASDPWLAVKPTCWA